MFERYQSKLSRIAIILLVGLVAPVAALAQQQVNTIHLSGFAAQAAAKSKPSVPQLAGKWDILSTDPGGDQYNISGGGYLGPIEFTVDFTQSDTSLTQITGHTFTSSACSADGAATVTGEITPKGKSGNAEVEFTATVDNGYSDTFIGKYKKNNPSRISGTWSTSAGACGLQNGDFTAYQYNQLTNNSYLGDFTSDITGLLVSGVTANLQEASNFTISGAVIAPANSCFHDLTIDPAQSFASGGLAEFFATNNQGALVAFNASNMDSSFLQLPYDQPNETSLFITYAVLQGGGSCQAGDAGHDAVFHLAAPRPVNPPIRPILMHRPR